MSGRIILVSALEYDPTTKHDYTKSDIMVGHAWIRTAPPNAPALTMFATIYNNTTSNLRLVGAYSKAYQNIELFRSIRAGDVMRMARQSYIPIPAIDKLVMEPGDWHMMVLYPNPMPKEGDIVPVTLQFDNGSTHTIHAEVKRAKVTDHILHGEHEHEHPSK